MKKLRIEDYEEELKKEDYDAIYQKIIDEVLLLVMEIGSFKKFVLPKLPKEELLIKIEFSMKEDLGLFQDVFYLARELRRWEYVGGIEDTPEGKIKDYITRYNAISDMLEKYQKVNSTTLERGYDLLLREKEERLCEIFKEMLSYKNQSYEKSDSFFSLLEKASRAYPYYASLLEEGVSAIRNHNLCNFEEEVIPLDETEIIMLLEDLIETLTWEGDNYQNYANFYREFPLQEGETYQDLYEKEKEKYKELFRKMLDYVKESYSSDDDFYTLKHKVGECYPYYRDRLNSLVPKDPRISYIQILDSLETKYEFLLSDYQNIEKNRMQYEEEKTIGEDLDFFE